MLLGELLLAGLHRSGVLVVSLTESRDQSGAVIVILLESQHLRRRLERGSVALLHRRDLGLVLGVCVGEDLGVSGVSRLELALVPLRKARFQVLALLGVGVIAGSHGVGELGRMLAVLVDLEGCSGGLKLRLILALLSRQ